MTDTPAPADVKKWIISVLGCEGTVAVEAVTVENQWAGGGSVHSAGDVMMTILRDADDELVFQAPADGIAYLHRAP